MFAEDLSVPSLSSVFHGVWHRARDRRSSDLLWKVVINRLPVGAKIHHFSTHYHCLCAGDHIETVRHLFWECVVARRVWRAALVLLNRVYPLVTGISCVSALFGKSPHRRIHSSIWHALHGSVVSAIWASRCRALINHDPSFYMSKRIIASALFKFRRQLDAKVLFPGVDLARIIAFLSWLLFLSSILCLHQCLYTLCCLYFPLLISVTLCFVFGVLCFVADITESLYYL